MINVAFVLDDWMQHVGQIEPKTTIHRWTQNMKALGVSKIWMVDETTYNVGQYYNHHDSNIEFQLISSIEELRSKYLDDIVHLEKTNTSQLVSSTDLPDFIHPTNALYIVGRDSSGLFQNENNTTSRDHWVHIPMINDNAFYSDVAMSIVLYSRMING